MKEIKIHSLEDAARLAVSWEFYRNRYTLGLNQALAQIITPLNTFLSGKNEKFELILESITAPFPNVGVYVRAMDKSGLLPDKFKPFADLLEKEREVFRLAHVLHSSEARGGTGLKFFFKPGFERTESYKRVKRNLDRIPPTGRLSGDPKINFRLIPRNIASHTDLFNQYLVCEDILGFLQENLEPGKLSKEIARAKKKAEAAKRDLIAIGDKEGRGKRLARQQVAGRFEIADYFGRLQELTIKRKLVPPRPNSFNKCRRLIRKLKIPRMPLRFALKRGRQKAIRTKETLQKRRYSRQARRR